MDTILPHLVTLLVVSVSMILPSSELVDTIYYLTWPPSWCKCCTYPLQSSVWIQLPAHTPDGIHIHGTPPRSLLYTFVRTPSPPWSRTPCHTKQDKSRCSMSSSRKPPKCAKMRSKCARQLCIITLLLEPLNI